MVSRFLTESESKYSNIEYQCLGLMFGKEKSEYCCREDVVPETDNSLLQQIFKKNMAVVLARLQRLLLKCVTFDIEVKYKQGKPIQVADALSYVCGGT